MFKKNNSKGFTLIELLIVIIIIGILAAIAFVAYSGAQKKAHKSAAQSTVAEIKNKMAEYQAGHGTFPDTKGSMVNWLKSDEGGNNDDMATDFGKDGYSLTVTPTGCGDAVAADGTVTAGSAVCTGFTVTATGSSLGFDGTVEAGN